MPESGESLGVPSGRVRLVAHDERWAAAFVELRSRIAAIVSGGAEIEHVGSTSVPGLVAKPLLDVAVGVADGELEAACERLGEQFEFRGDHGREGGICFAQVLPRQGRQSFTSSSGATLSGRGTWPSVTTSWRTARPANATPS